MALRATEGKPDTLAPHTLYVDATHGDDRHSGRARAFDGTHGPKRTIQAAAVAAEDGATVEIASGAYREPGFGSGRIVLHTTGTVVIQ